MITFRLGCDGEEAPRGANVVALGFFDGVHTGHRELLALAVSEARSIGADPAAFIFADTETFKPSSPRILSEADKLALLEECGIEKVFLADFSDIASLTPEEFVRDVLIGKCKAKGAVCGYNFRFGCGAVAGSMELSTLMMSERRFARVLRPVYFGNIPVSSSSIRAAIENGDIETANEMLGRPFSLSAPVLHGHEIGTSIGFPTANQYIPERTVVPAYGVYHCECEVDGVKYPAVTNVGIRPTVNDGSEAVNCESHIIGFSGDLYGKTVRVHFLRRLRDEIKFEELYELRRQIEKDTEEVKKYYV